MPTELLHTSTTDLPPGSTAVLFFSRSVAAEAAGKQFSHDAAINERMANELIARTKRTLAQTGLPVIRSNEHNQQGNTFGQRLTNAILDAFAGGYQYLLIVGNDAPGLTAGQLRHAATVVEGGRSIILPDQRGGLALLGLALTHFPAPAAFAQLPWETPQLLAALAKLLPAAVRLRPVRDVNSLRDLRTAWHALRSRLSRLADLFTLPSSPTKIPLNLTVFVRRFRAGRAPPVAVV